MKTMVETDELPPPLPKKKGGTLSTNADNEFLKVVPDPARDSCRRSLQQNNHFRRSSKLDPDIQKGLRTEERPLRASRMHSHDPDLEDEDEMTNFLIEKNVRRQKRYFGASIKNSAANIGLSSKAKKDYRTPKEASSCQRNPTLGEIIRGEMKNSSKRSLQNFSTLQRSSQIYSSERQIVVPPPPHFSDAEIRDIAERSVIVPENSPFKQKPVKDLTKIGKNKGQKTSVGNFENALTKDTISPYIDKSKFHCIGHGSKVNNWLHAFNTENTPKTVKDAITSIQNSNKNELKKSNRYETRNKEEFTVRTEYDAAKTELSTENAFFKRNCFKKGIPDHLERDSLDGNLPSSSHGTSTGNPPLPPTPPDSSNINSSNISSNDNTNANNAVNNNPEGTDVSLSGYSKGPNAKSTKHKRLKNDTGTLDFPTRETEGKKRPSYDGPSSRDVETGGFRSKTEPYTYLWVVLSRMYGKLIVLLMLAFCLTEVLDNTIAPLTFQEVFLLYLYVGSIIAIMCIYVTVIIDNCPSITTASKENLTKPRDPESGSITSFGTLKRAHISRSKTSRTSFYLRVGALVFGLGSLIYNGLEIAMQSSIPEGCLSDTILAHPIMQALFTFLQMHFLFVNSEVIVEKFGQIARFGFMHLVATNLALWVRMVVWESANDSMEVIEKKKDIFENTVGPKALGFHTMELQRLSKCYQNNTLGNLWLDSQQYLFPFLVQYSLIAASVTYIMWCNVGKERLHKLNRHNKSPSDMSSNLDKRSKGHWKVDCRSASKGLFLGLLVLVGGIIILIIFFVMKNQIDFRPDLFWMINGTMTVIFSLSIFATIFGFIQIPKLSISTTKPMDLDRLLLSSTVIGVYIFAIFGMIVGGIDYNNSEKFAAFGSNLLLLIQVSLQGMLVAEASRRTCTNRLQMLTKPGRQVITFLLFSNITLWILDTFMTHNSITHQFQIEFYGKVVWGVISRISLPLMILFRFHSAVILVEIWKNTYRTKAD